MALKVHVKGVVEVEGTLFSSRARLKLAEVDVSLTEFVQTVEKGSWFVDASEDERGLVRPCVTFRPVTVALANYKEPSVVVLVIFDTNLYLLKTIELCCELTCDNCHSLLFCLTQNFCGASCVCPCLSNQSS